MQSILITGANREERREKVTDFVASKTSEFDITSIEGETLGIAKVRTFISKISLKPINSLQKYIIIYEAQNLSIDAQNALLKTLEEPPGDTTIILTAPNEELLLATIVSRCKLVRLKTDNRQAKTEEQSIILHHLSLIISGGVGNRLKVAQDAAKTREDVIAWLEKAIPAGRRVLLGRLDVRYLSLLKGLQKAHLTIKTTNVNPRLALENLFLNL